MEFNVFCSLERGNFLKKRIKRYLLLGFTFPVAVCFSSCSFFPKEEVAKPLAFYKEETVKKYDTVPVRRGSKKSEENITCVLKSAKTVELSFQVDGFAMDRVNVQEGSPVRKGELLAQLDLSDLEQKKTDTKREQENKKNEIEHNEKLLEIKRRGLQYIEDNETRENCQSEIKGIVNKIASLKQEYAIECRQYEYMNQKMKERRIYAPMDGIVTDLLELDPGEAPRKGQKYITVSGDNMVFQNEKAITSKVKEGQAVTLKVNNMPYKAHIVKVSGKQGHFNISVQMDEKKNFEKGTLGKIQFMEEGFQDSLYIPSSCIFEINKKPAVYLVDENQIRHVVWIERGITAGQYTQIISGLKEGDNIVKG